MDGVIADILALVARHGHVKRIVALQIGRVPGERRVRFAVGLFLGVRIHVDGLAGKHREHVIAAVAVIGGNCNGYGIHTGRVQGDRFACGVAPARGLDAVHRYAHGGEGAARYGQNGGGDHVVHGDICGKGAVRLLGEALERNAGDIAEFHADQIDIIIIQNQVGIRYHSVRADGVERKGFGVLRFAAEGQQAVVRRALQVALLLLDHGAGLVQQGNDQVAGGGLAEARVLHVHRYRSGCGVALAIDHKIAGQRHVLPGAGLQVIAGNAGGVVGAVEFGINFAVADHFGKDIYRHAAFGDLYGFGGIALYIGRHVKGRLYAVAALVDHLQIGVIRNGNGGQERFVDGRFEGGIGIEADAHAAAAVRQSGVAAVIELHLDHALPVDFFHDRGVADLQVGEIKVYDAFGCDIAGLCEFRGHGVSGVLHLILGHLVIRPYRQGGAGQEVQIIKYGGGIAELDRKLIDGVDAAVAHAKADLRLRAELDGLIVRHQTAHLDLIFIRIRGGVNGACRFGYGIGNGFAVHGLAGLGLGGAVLAVGSAEHRGADLRAAGSVSVKVVDQGGVRHFGDVQSAGKADQFAVFAVGVEFYAAQHVLFGGNVTHVRSIAAAARAGALGQVVDRALVALHPYDGKLVDIRRVFGEAEIGADIYVAVRGGLAEALRHLLTGNAGIIEIEQADIRYGIAVGFGL